MLSRRQKSQLKFLTAALVAFLLVGGFVGGALYMITNRSGSTECGRFVAGQAADIEQRLEEGGPYFVTGGGNCAFWLALDDGVTVAVRPRMDANDCTVRWRAHSTPGHAAAPRSPSEIWSATPHRSGPEMSTAPSSSTSATPQPPTP
ncbi:MAG: hypothetical protein M5T61_08350 [Acidimicrobiia bacterium]|nr:hypothetical protein [Acidimicrobiia bacterium]